MVTFQLLSNICAGWNGERVTGTSCAVKEYVYQYWWPLVMRGLWGGAPIMESFGESRDPRDLPVVQFIESVRGSGFFTLYDVFSMAWQSREGGLDAEDRKSTRLNSSHSQNSYGGFFL